MLMMYFSKVKACRAATDTHRGWRMEGADYMGSGKMTDAIEIIHRDHVNIDQVLNVLETTVDGPAPDQAKADLEPLYLAI